MAGLMQIYMQWKRSCLANTSIGYGGAWFDNQFNQQKLMVGKQEKYNSYVGSIMDRLNNLIGN